MEFTDRYGGRAPSWLRACHGGCEAMGVLPIHRNGFDAALDGLELADQPLTTAELAAWDALHVDEQFRGDPCDGWHFIPCTECGGSGRVSWLRTLARLPGWAVCGARFFLTALNHPGNPPTWSLWRRVRIAAWSAWGADLARLLR